MANDAHGRWTTDDARRLSALLLGHTPSYGVLFMDEQGIVTAWGEGAHFITGFEADDIVGRSGALLFVEEDRRREMHEHELATARATGLAEDERWHVRRDGSRFWASGMTLRLDASMDGGPLAFVKMFKDTTHLKARARTLENEVEHLHRARAEHDVFLGTIAHELRNPLAPLHNVATLLDRQQGPHDTQQILRIMRRQLGFLERLVEDLVDLTRVHTGKLRVAYETVELQRVLQGAFDACTDRAGEAGVVLQRVFPSVPIEIDADPLRLNQVVVNLLQNAIKFTPAGGAVSLVASVASCHALIIVRDTGQGIGPDLLPHIFEMFTQASDAGSHRGEGLGIGLAVVKEIVALHHGSVEVRSEGAGKGSEFFVRLPLQRPPAGGVTPPAAA